MSTLCEFIADKGIDVVLTAISVVIGYRLGVAADARQRKRDQDTRRQELLTELRQSLETNLGLLDQVTDKHFKAGELPTFHLDSTWLHYFASTVCLDIPSVSQYRQSYNRLRFELDHINKKFDLLFLFSAFLPTEPPAKPKDEQRAQQESFVSLFHSTSHHVNDAKKWLSDEIVLLKTLGA